MNTHGKNGNTEMRAVCRDGRSEMLGLFVGIDETDGANVMLGLIVGIDKVEGK